MTQTAIWLLVIGGGTLQVLRTETNHPSLALKIWGWAYAVAGLVLIFWDEARYYSSRSCVSIR
jgi:hypothetical protein